MALIVDHVAATGGVDGYVAPALGALILLMIGWAVTLLREIRKQQVDQGTKLTDVWATLFGVGGAEGLAARVDRLHAWKNDQTKTQLDRANSENERLERALEDERRHGPIDRRAS